MKPIYPVMLDRAGVIYQPVDVNAVLSNLLNAVFLTQDKPAYVAAVPPLVLDELVAAGCENETEWFGGDYNVLANELDANKRVELIAKKVMPFAIALAQQPVYVPSIGRELRASLTRVGRGAWEEVYVTSPTLGYARPYMRLSMQSPADRSHVVTASPGSEWSMAIARICTRLDVARMSPSLFPETRDTMGHDPRSRPFGMAFATMRQVRRPWAMAALYRLQGTILPLLINEKRIRYEYELAYAREPRARTALERWMENYEFIISQPAHTIVRLLADVLQDRTIVTYLGKHKVIYATDLTFPAQDSGSAPVYDALLKEAIADYGRAQDVVCWASDPTTAKEGDAAAAMSVGAVARALRSVGESTTLWPTLATDLGWHRITVSGGEARQAAADWILTDGIGFSDDPFGALIGLRPCLSVSNRRMSGFDRRWQGDFLAVLNQNWSTIPIQGHQSPDADGGAFARSFIPSGMWMGEPDAETRYMQPADTDRIAVAVRDFYKKKSGQYVIEGFGSGVPSDAVPPSDWEMYASAGSAVQAQGLMLAAYQGDTRPADHGEYYYRKEFYHRVPVARSTRALYAFYDDLGTWRITLEQDGNVLFDNESTVGMSGTSLQTMVDGLVTANRADATLKNLADARIDDPNAEIKA